MKSLDLAVQTNQVTLSSLLSQLDEILSNVDQRHAGYQKKWDQRGFINAREFDEIESLLFQFSKCHYGLTEITRSVGGREVVGEPAWKLAELRAHLLVMAAQYELVYGCARIVDTFANDALGKAAMNSAYVRSDIPAGQYNSWKREVMNSKRLRHVHESWRLHQLDEKQNPELYQQIRNDAETGAEYSKLLDGLPGQYENAVSLLSKLQGKGVLSGIVEEVEQTKVAGFSRKLAADSAGARYSARSRVFKDVSRLKDPRAKLISFSDQQKSDLHGVLEPGDIVMTYTAGYMSNVFIPGVFKHGMTYIGEPADRQKVGLYDVTYPAWMKKPNQLDSWLREPQTLSGEPATVIEAVAEGVKFSSLDHILDTHVNRLCVLRPKLTDYERQLFLLKTFSYLGYPYDFIFDFSDASRQVCTEVIYRSLDGKADLDFKLTKRGGHLTLTADDMMIYHLENPGKHFELVAYAEKGASGNDAQFSYGEEAERRIRELLDEID
ncbi:YiiX/YebB-like N1pC/P60 family cysteine hydrolase [Persicirhabdus sediminis]|uniref:Permuted papain-like amidase enzyme, YaeF/YiiX, C92 family n=1 Tax=Persicirhabdus sediminis TaxID=454144 RepID=A0A8J7MGX1_9BACT|nr:YiiX/YebB-like N1pC/P60 family cysteine hydrolase [Persicirhabdus sediminis]MBK1792646.1 hypothetical protein [Persicirhabdus sediminis]